MSHTEVDFIQCILITWKFNTLIIYKCYSKQGFPVSFNPFHSPAPGKVVNLTVEAFNYSAVNLIWYLPRQPNGKITSFKISVKHARSGIVVKDVSIRVEDLLNGKLPECNVSIVNILYVSKTLDKLIFKFLASRHCIFYGNCYFFVIYTIWP